MMCLESGWCWGRSSDVMCLESGWCWGGCSDVMCLESGCVYRCTFKLALLSNNRSTQGWSFT